MRQVLQRYRPRLRAVILRNEHRVPARGALEAKYFGTVAILHLHHPRAPWCIVERAMRFAEGNPVADQRTIGVLLPHNRVFLEELKPFAVARFLPVINQRDALTGEQQGEGIGQGDSEPFEFSPRPRILVMVRRKNHTLRAGRPRTLILAVETVKRAGIGLPLGDLLHRLRPGPAVAGVETAHVKIAVIEFAKHPHRLDSVQIAAHLIPEVGRHITSDVAAVSVDAKLAHPISHVARHLAAQSRFGIIEVDDIRPVPPRGRDMRAFPVAGIPVGMLRYPIIVPRGMVGDPVEDDLHALRMGGVDERLEIRLGAEIGIDRAIVTNAVRTAERPLAVFLPDRMDRHQPQYVDPKRFEPRKLAGCGVERPLAGELASVDLVNNGLLRPGGMPDPLKRLRRVRIGWFGKERGGRAQQRQGNQGTKHGFSLSMRRRGERARL